MAAPEPAENFMVAFPGSDVEDTPKSMIPMSPVPTDNSLEQQVSENSQTLKLLKQTIMGWRMENNKQMERILDALNVEEPASSDLKSPAFEKNDSRVMAWKATADLLQSTLNERDTDSNRETESLRGNIEELQRETSTKTEEIQDLTNDRNKWQHQSELWRQRVEERVSSEELKSELIQSPIHFPSNETIIHNLLIAQIEFYFSDHHLKRDKPLMQKLTTDPIGFINFDEVCSFPKVRTLGQDKEVIRKAVCDSKYLTVKKDGVNVICVGRQEFNPPRAQEFPFRRTVFVYGIPLDHATDNWIRHKFDCFGTIQKVKFDSGPASSPRKVGARLLAKEPSRVTRLQIIDKNHTEFKFSKDVPTEKLCTYFCHKCGRLKEYADGYYSSTGPQNAYLFCIQCAAKKAEENLKFYSSTNKNYSDDKQVRKLYGIDEASAEDVNKFSTCLVVYESQRQASKCVYVRSRLGIDGCFATHFHNYTRNKKDICQGIEAPPMMNRNDSSSTHKLVKVPSMRAHRTSGARFDMKSPGMRRFASVPAHFGGNRI